MQLYRSYCLQKSWVPTRRTLIVPTKTHSNLWRTLMDYVMSSFPQKKNRKGKSMWRYFLGDWLWTWGNKYHLGYSKEHYLGRFLQHFSKALGSLISSNRRTNARMVSWVFDTCDRVWPLKNQKTENNVSGKGRRCEQQLAFAKVKIEVANQTVWIYQKRFAEASDCMRDFFHYSPNLEGKDIRASFDLISERW